MIKKHIAFALFLIIYNTVIINSQTVLNLSWDASIPVIHLGDTLKFAWLGGLNYPQFSNIDLNNDNIQDLLIFDRTGNRLVCLMNQGMPGQISYTIHPELSFQFPSITDWVLLLDYDNDNKKDVFHYWNGSVQVHKNISTTSQLAFQLVKSQIISDYGNFQMPIYISSADIPAITDVDYDGDIDILTFNFLGGCIEYHQNQSKELYGHSDSLIFKLKSDNWGNFAEGNSATDIFLNDSCDSQNILVGNGLRHAGSSLLAIDVDNDNDKDLILGDVDATFLTFLRNNGTSQLAQMNYYEFNFPQNFNATTPVNILTFPAAFYVDVDNNQKNDLIVAPNSPFNSETSQNIWYYKNIGNNTLPIFTLQTTGFLQDEMIEVGEGAYPAWFDYNRDGLMDLVIGNSNYFNGVGQLALYKNVGSSTNPAFELITKDYANLSSFGFTNIIPSFGDLDGDGDKDMIIGETSGYLHYFENIAPVAPNSIASFATPIQNYFQIKQISHSAPFIIDLNQDGLNDIVCGSRNGKLFYYKNMGTANSPNFNPSNTNPATPTIANLGNIDVVDPSFSSSGYSIPYFFTFNGKWHLAVGSLRGTIFYYDQIFDTLTNQINSEFRLIDDKLAGINIGHRSSPALYDINNDGLYDMVVGNYSGGVNFYKGSVGYLSVSQTLSHSSIQIFPNPFIDEINIHVSFDNYSVNIYTITGIKVYSGKFNQKILNLKPSLSEGMYIFSISNQEKQWQFKVLKM